VNTIMFAESVTRQSSPRGFVRATDAQLPKGFEAGLDAHMLGELERFYGELELGFTKTHVPQVGLSVPAIGFSTLTKHAFAITDGANVLGKVVCTLKRNGSLKIGPIYLLPEFRQRGNASSFLRSFVTLAHSAGVRSVYATVPRPNVDAQRLFHASGFLRVGCLKDHYREGVAEDVFAFDAPAEKAGHSLSTSPGEVLSRASYGEASVVRACSRYVAAEYFPVDEKWERWLASPTMGSLGDFSRKPHDIVETSDEIALVIYKRGGTAKVVPIVGNRSSPTQRLVEACESHARRHGRRKVSMFLPERFDGPSKYVREVTAARYSLQGPIAVWSHKMDD
jgi:ribosomal protein S18 acetylase RimI-like enzyme